MTLLMVAVAADSVALGADSLWFELRRDSTVDAVRCDERKVFAGAHILTGMAGVADSDAGSLVASVEAVARHARGLDEARELLVATTPFLPEAIGQWRLAHPTMPLGAFATVAIAGVSDGMAAAQVLAPEAEQGGWVRTGHTIVADSDGTAIAAYGTIPDAAGVYCGGWNDYAAQRRIEAAIRGDVELPPQPPQNGAMPASATAADLAACLRQAVTDGMHDQRGVQQVPGIPATQPLLGGKPQVVSL